MRQYAQYMLSCRLQQKIKKVPKAFALDTDKSILSQFEIETICFNYIYFPQICQKEFRYDQLQNSY